MEGELEPIMTMNYVERSTATYGHRIHTFHRFHSPCPDRLAPYTRVQ